MDAETLATQKVSHRAQRELLAAYFAAHSFQVVTHETLVELVGENYRSRISELRRQMPIENVPVFHQIDGKRVRGYGSYRHRPEALGREASDFTAYKPQTLFDEPSGWQS